MKAGSSSPRRRAFSIAAATVVTLVLLIRPNVFAFDTGKRANALRYAEPHLAQPHLAQPHLAQPPVPTARTTAASAAQVVQVSNAYALPAMKGGNGGAFMQISNAGRVAVRIVRVTSADARVVELHESMEHNGATHMQPLAALDIPPGASVSLKAGGKHFMLVDLRRAFAVGDTMRLVLAIENPGGKSGSAARNLTVTVPVRIP